MTAERESTSTGLNESPHPKAGKLQIAQELLAMPTRPQ